MASRTGRWSDAMARSAQCDGSVHRRHRAGSPRSSSASSRSISSSRCCCAISSAYQIPDSYDFGRLLLGILIFWGIAATSYRGTHITVDLVWANVGAARYSADRRVRDAGAAVRGDGADLHAVRQGRGTYADNVLTFDLRLPTWPFFLVAWLGDVSAVLLIAIRTYRLIFHPELMGGQYQIKPVE
jgi:TRAP-type transport system small permease protein